VTAAVKTLHPKVHAGICAPRHPDDMEAIARSASSRSTSSSSISIRLQKQARQGPARLRDLVEQIDHRRPSMVRARERTSAIVLIVVLPADYPRLLAAIDRVRPFASDTS